MSTEDDLPLRITHGPGIQPRTVTIEQYEEVVAKMHVLVTAIRQLQSMIEDMDL